MFSFEGQFKSTPQQSLGGASIKLQKDELIEKVQSERRKRQEQKLQMKCATTIQAFYRGYTARKIQSLKNRKEFNELQKALDISKPADAQQIFCLLRNLIKFYSVKVDSERLTWLCQMFIKNVNIIKKMCNHNVGSTSYTLMIISVARLLCITVKQLSLSATCPSLSLGPLLRTLECFLLPSFYERHQSYHHILLTLVQKGYFQMLWVLFKHKVPSLDEEPVNHPTPLSSSLIDFVYIPLHYCKTTADTTEKTIILTTFCKDFLSSPYPSQIQFYVLPNLAKEKDKFPLSELLDAVSDFDIRNQSSIWLLYALLMLSKSHLSDMRDVQLAHFLTVISKLSFHLKSAHFSGLFDSLDDEDDDDNAGCSEASHKMIDSCQNEEIVRQMCIGILNDVSNVPTFLRAANFNFDNSVIVSLCNICYILMTENRQPIHETRLLYSLAFHSGFLRLVWNECLSKSSKIVTGSSVSLIQTLSRGTSISQTELNSILTLLSTFCSLFSHSLVCLYDAEFYGEEPDIQSRMPFSLSECVAISSTLSDVCLGIIWLSHPDHRPPVKSDIDKVTHTVTGLESSLMTPEELEYKRCSLAYLFKTVSSLVRQFHARDTRRRFCPPNHWLSPHVSIVADRLSQLYRAQETVFVRRPFGYLSTLSVQKPKFDEMPLLSTTEVRHLAILTEIPFVVSFQERVKIFHRLSSEDRLEQQGEMRHLYGGPAIRITVRRNYLYEDAFEKLSPENEPNLKLRMQVQLLNFAGLDEAGIDGGGLFREFLSELLKTGFDPNRGFFQSTSDKFLYPNPQAQQLFENYQSHYYFLGRMLGKAIYENMLVELPFAHFFLFKILSRHGDVDIHHLQSLDPVIYKNLLFLKNYNGDVSELGLDFTVVLDDFGKTRIVELKSGGKDITVTNNNRIEYIHLMANYRLNRQIRSQCNAFRRGLSEVVNLEWLRMFDQRELQVLISGAPVPIDVIDLRRHTNYSGGYNENHPVIENFWRVIDEFNDETRRKLLKFVTSCSQPPLLGFKELVPSFCIHYAGNQADRLPTASTCMNLLKLPEFKDETTLKEKLMYALESGAGFELS